METHMILKKYIETQLLSNGSRVNFDEDLLMSGIINSLDVIRLVSFAQEEFNIEVPAADVVIENFRTIDALAIYIQSRS